MRADREPATVRVLRLLDAGPMTRPQLAARIGYDPQQTLVRLLKAGAVIVRENDRDGLSQARLYERTR